MNQIHHLNCGWLHKPPSPKASCHCLLVESDTALVLIDSGIGLYDIAEPTRRVGQAAIDAAGFIFTEATTAVRQIESLELDPAEVTDIVLTHADPDHAGGLTDFPNATVHIGERELSEAKSGKARYRQEQFEHGPDWRPHLLDDHEWYGLPASVFNLDDSLDIRLVSLPGHTLGHCGVAVRNGKDWLLHVGDAYYLRGELDEDEHPITPLARLAAEDDAQRMKSIEHLRRIRRDHADEVKMVGYHDVTELPDPT